MRVCKRAHMHARTLCAFLVQCHSLHCPKFLKTVCKQPRVRTHTNNDNCVRGGGGGEINKNGVEYSTHKHGVRIRVCPAIARGTRVVSDAVFTHGELYIVSYRS